MNFINSVVNKDGTTSQPQHQSPHSRQGHNQYHYHEEDSSLLDQDSHFQHKDTNSRQNQQSYQSNKKDDIWDSWSSQGEQQSNNGHVRSDPKKDKEDLDNFLANESSSNHQQPNNKKNNVTRVDDANFMGFDVEEKQPPQRTETKEEDSFWDEFDKKVTMSDNSKNNTKAANNKPQEELWDFSSVNSTQENVAPADNNHVAGAQNGNGSVKQQGWEENWDDWGDWDKKK